MSNIVHIAVKVDDLDAVENLYTKVFGFTSLGRSHSPGRSRVQLTDGRQFNLTFLKYDSEDEPMAKAVGPGGQIHHFAIEVEDMTGYAKQVQDAGCELLSPPDVVPVKFRMPGGPIAEIVPMGSFAGGRERRGG
jgi:catechol 2,3-dioxygenase-like lactoylglutathione lyase family enzyme